jgi:16S rRNA processing protein RimM
LTARDSGGAGRAKGEGRAAASFGAFARKPVARDQAAAASSQVSASAEPADSGVWPDDIIEVGAIVDAYGLKGWVKVAAHADAGRGGDALLSAKRWWLEKGGERRVVRALQSKVHSDHIVAQLSEAADRDQALALRGYRISVSRSDFPALETDEFYWVDLIGLAVVNEAGVALGTVADMIDNGAQSVMRVEYPVDGKSGKDGKPPVGERLIPFVGVYVKTVDQAAKQITVDWQADY